MQLVGAFKMHLHTCLLQVNFGGGGRFRPSEGGCNPLGGGREVPFGFSQAFPLENKLFVLVVAAKKGKRNGIRLHVQFHVLPSS